jgi:HAD superfamily hydrolase (TIGR01549 family)
VQVKTDAFSILYNKYGNDIVRKVIDHHESNGGISRFEKIELYHKKFLNKSITDQEIKELSNQFSNLVLKKVIDSPYVPGALEYIRKSHEHYKLFISTGTPTSEMIQILDRRNIAQLFTAVYGSPDKKNVHIKKIISKYKYKEDELIFYGDANTDIEAAEEAKIPFVLIENSFNEKLVNSFRGKIISNFSGLL